MIKDKITEKIKNYKKIDQSFKDFLLVAVLMLTIVAVGGMVSLNMNDNMWTQEAMYHNGTIYYGEDNESTPEDDYVGIVSIQHEKVDDIDSVIVEQNGQYYNIDLSGVDSDTYFTYVDVSENICFEGT